jgi:hypothetical protein
VVWHCQSNGAACDWQALDNPGGGDWPTIERDVPTPELPAPAVVSYGGNQLDLFWLWPDNTLRCRHFNGASWDAWRDLGGMLASGPGAVAHDGQVDVYARGVDDALWTRSYPQSLGKCEEGAWQRVDRPGMPDPVTIDSAPAVVSPAAGRVLVTVRGSNDGLWQLAYDGDHWGNWHLAGLDQSAEGYSGQAVAFDGVDDYVDLPDNFPKVDAFTFAAWVNW